MSKEKDVHPIELLKKYQPNIAKDFPDVYINSLEEMLRLYYDAYKGNLERVEKLLSRQDNDLHNAFKDGVQYGVNQETTND